MLDIRTCIGIFFVQCCTPGFPPEQHNWSGAREKIRGILLHSLNHIKGRGFKNTVVQHHSK